MPSAPKYTALGNGRSALNVDALNVDGNAVSTLTGSRSQWTANLILTSTTSVATVAQIPWIVSDSPHATTKKLHLRAILATPTSGVQAGLRLRSRLTGEYLTIMSGEDNLFQLTTPGTAILESDVDLFTSPIEVFDPSVDQMLGLNLTSSGGEVNVYFAELILVD